MRAIRLILLFLFAGVFSLQSCKKVEKEMLVTTGTVTNILTTTADVTGNILDLGEGATNYGHCYSTSPNVKISGPKTEFVDPSIGGFTSALTSLDPSTKYYIKAYLSRGTDVVYGDEINFTTASPDLPEITTTTVSGITKTGAVSGGNITNQGGTQVTARGVCWSTANITTLTANKTTNGTGTGLFTSEISGLAAGTTYYVRAYATNSGGTKLGNEVSFGTTPDTPVPPSVTTASVSAVTSNSAVCGGTVTNEGSASVTSKGVCFNTSANPTILNSTTNNGTGPGSFVSNISGLDPGTKYYIRAYATSSAGTTYGEESSFTTDALIPSITTIEVTSITSFSASSGGDITSTGGASITVKGVCWSTTHDPTTLNFKSTDGIGSDDFISAITNLAPATTYYVRAYATNIVGTGYGNELSFTTLCAEPSSVSEAASNIGTNAATIKGTVNANNFSTTIKFEYGTTLSYGTEVSATPGTAIGSLNTAVSYEMSGLTPNTLYHYRVKANSCGGTTFSSDQTFTTLCAAPSITTSAASNSGSSYSTLNGVVNANNSLTSLTFEYGLTTGYGASITATPSVATGMSNTSVSAGISGLVSNATYHFYLKAINCGGTSNGSDKTFVTLPIVTTTAISNITTSSASGGGIITPGGGENIIARGVCWSVFPNPTIDHSKTIDGAGTGSYSSSMTSLNSWTMYYVRAYATNSAGTAYGNEVTFITPRTFTHTAVGVVPLTKTVTYGIVYTNLSGSNKYWITQNLGADNSASSVTDATEAAAGWYWQFNSRQGYKHDGTTRTPNTTWITSINEASNWTIGNDPCYLLLGSGWRIPTLTEWTNADNNGGWDNPNETFASVFKLHVAGVLTNTGGNLYGIGTYGGFWSSTQYSNTEASYYNLFTGGNAEVYHMWKPYGQSIRCIKD